jgi:hypothetical protein
MPKVLERVTQPQQTPKTAPVPTTPPPAPQTIAVSNGTPTKKIERPIFYPELKINGVSVPRANLKITVRMAKDMLGWETEEEYATRQMAKYPGTPRERYRFKAPNSDDPILKNAPEYQLKIGETKIVCWRNANNRPLDEGWVDRLSQDVLMREWRFNCETIIISKTRLVESGQHRLIALILAAETWAGPNKEHWQTYWQEKPWIESLVAFGADETPEVLMTLDATKARTEADNFTQIELIDWTTKTTQKRECAKMLQESLDVVWKRTGAQGSGSFSRYKTHSVALDFVRKHPTLLKCVRHIWEENSRDGRAISVLLRSGKAAGMLYLMGSCQSDGDQYRHHVTAAERTEESLDWGMLAKAKEFFSTLAASDPDVEGGSKTAQKAMKPVRYAIGAIKDPEIGAGGSDDEKTAVIAKAWAVYAAGHQIEDADLVLRYHEERASDGALIDRWLNECPIFGGIDTGVTVKDVKAKQTAQAPTAEKIRESKDALRKQKDEELKKRVEESKARIAPTVVEKQKAQLELFKSQNLGKLIIIEHPSGAYRVYGTDAMVLSKTTGIDLNETQDPVTFAIAKADSAEMLAKIAQVHDNVVVIKKETTPVGEPAKFSVTLLTYTAPPEHVESVPIQGQH